MALLNMQHCALVYLLSLCALTTVFGQKPSSIRTNGIEVGVDKAGYFISWVPKQPPMTTTKQPGQGNMTSEDDDDSEEKDWDKKRMKIVGKIHRITEEDSTAKSVGKSGKRKHTHMGGLRSDDFGQIGQTTDCTIPNSNVTALCSVAGGTMNEVGSKVMFYLYVAKENGSIVIGDEETQILAGNVKLSFQLSNWMFCGCGPNLTPNCEECKKGQTSEIGTSVMFSFRTLTPGDVKEKPDSAEDNDDHSRQKRAKSSKAAKGSKGGRSKGKRGKKYEIGPGLDLIMSQKIQCDGKTLDNDGVSMKTEGSNTYMNINFPRFANNCTYDPVVELGGVNGAAPYEGDQDDTSGGGSSSGGNSQHTTQHTGIFLLALISLVSGAVLSVI